MSDRNPTGAQKRVVYVVAFCIALAVDVVSCLVRDVPYRPSLIGLAIMIASALWFAWSWIRER